MSTSPLASRRLRALLARELGAAGHVTITRGARRWVIAAEDPIDVDQGDELEAVR